MHTENSLLKRTYLIGGAPRIGKSLFASRLADRVKGHVTSTDSIVVAAKKACSDSKSDLFAVNHHQDIPEEEWKHNHQTVPQITIDLQNKESAAAWPSIHAFCNSFVEDDLVHIVEGVHLLPSLLSSLEHRPEHIIFLGNTNPKHAEYMLEHASQYPEKDWMTAVGYSEERIKAMAVFVNAMSAYFESEAKKYGFSYFELDSTRFDGSVDEILEAVSV